MDFHEFETFSEINKNKFFQSWNCFINSLNFFNCTQCGICSYLWPSIVKFVPFRLNFLIQNQSQNQSQLWGWVLNDLKSSKIHRMYLLNWKYWPRKGLNTTLWCTLKRVSKYWKNPNSKIRRKTFVLRYFNDLLVFMLFFSNNQHWFTFVKSIIFSIRRHFYQTISPSMNFQTKVNFFQCDICGK